jgi:hypothetical protein
LTRHLSRTTSSIGWRTGSRPFPACDWTTNEKTLLTKAGLRDVDGIVVSLSANVEQLQQRLNRPGPSAKEYSGADN